MKVGVVPTDIGGVGHYRMIWPAQAVKRATGWDVRIHERGRPLRDATGLDVVVVQRLSGPQNLDAIVQARLMGIGIVHDVDDALWSIDPDNQAYGYHNEIVGGLRRWELTDMACELADVVTTSTPLLARRYGVGKEPGKSRVIRNGLPGIGLVDHVPGPRDVVRIGWTGSLGAHPHDLEVLGDSVARVLAADERVRFAVIGEPAFRIAPRLGIPEDRIDALDWAPIRHYHREVRERIDVMLVPLQDTGFNRAKSWLKALEASGAGCAVVASGTEENVELAGRTAVTIVPRGASSLDWATAIRVAVAQVRHEPEKVRTPHLCHPLSIGARVQEWVGAWEAARR